MKNLILFVFMLLLALPALAQNRRDGNRNRDWDYRNGDHRPGDYRNGDYRPGDYRTDNRNWPGPHYPRPNPRRSCQVVMVDRYNRVVNRYWSTAAYRRGCIDGLRQCDWDLRRYGTWGARCAQVY